MRHLTSLFAGALFGLGLTISGMVDPAKVIGFLDIAGAWDPTLAFVMGGAMIPMFISWAFVKKMQSPIAESDFKIPTLTHIDPRLLSGAALFGIGWGLVGICPGPALSALTFGGESILIFVASMIGGMFLFKFSPFAN